jgi:hypothetical protein
MAWRSLRQAFATMPLIYVSTFLVYGVMTAGLDTATKYPALAAVLQRGSLVLRLVVFIPPYALSTAAVAAAAIATHRFILLDDAHPRIGRTTLQFSLWFIFVGVVLFLLDMARILDRRLMPDSGFTVIIGGAIWITKLAVAIHFALLFPSVAVGEKGAGFRDRIETSWRRMTGNFWLFLGGDFVALLPLFLALILGVIAAAIFSMLGTWGVLQTESFFEAMMPLATIVGALIDLVGFPILMVQAAIASWLYAWIQQQSGPVLEPSGPRKG